MNLAAIHIRAKEAGLDREAYCALLFRVAGVRSAKDLDEEQYKAEKRRAKRGKRRPPRRSSGQSGIMSYVRFSSLTSAMFTTSPESSKKESQEIFFQEMIF